VLPAMYTSTLASAALSQALRRLREYRQHIYHPLLVFDGESGHLIGALLRAGNTHASNSAVAVLKRIVSGLREK
jgi:hypothetical protein